MPQFVQHTLTSSHADRGAGDDRVSIDRTARSSHHARAGTRRITSSPELGSPELGSPELGSSALDVVAGGNDAEGGGRSSSHPQLLPSSSHLDEDPSSRTAAATVNQAEHQAPAAVAKISKNEMGFLEEESDLQGLLPFDEESDLQELLEPTTSTGSYMNGGDYMDLTVGADASPAKRRNHAFEKSGNRNFVRESWEKIFRRFYSVEAKLTFW